MISGANGAVGQNLIRLLSQSAKIVPTRIRALVRDLRRADKLRPLAAELIEVNYRDPAALRVAVEGAEAVVHLAGALKPRLGESLWEANGETALNILEAKDIYQVDTGPIAFPDLSERQELLVEHIWLAFVAFNVDHFADFVIEAPTPIIQDGREVARAQHYSKIVSLPAKNRLFAVEVAESL